MPRTTEELVGLCIELDDTVDAEFAIEAANALVTEICAPVALTNPAYDDVRLELIERWLAAHFYAVRESRLRQENISRLQDQYQSRVDIGFDVTHYGQQAMRLDTAGGLADLNNRTKTAGTKPTFPRRRIGLTYLGTQRETYP